MTNGLICMSKPRKGIRFISPKVSRMWSWKTSQSARSTSPCHPIQDQLGTLRDVSVTFLGRKVGDGCQHIARSKNASGRPKCNGPKIGVWRDEMPMNASETSSSNERSRWLYSTTSLPRRLRLMLRGRMRSYRWSGELVRAHS